MTDRARWQQHYDRGVAPSLAPYPDRTLLDYAADLARDRPHAPALLFKGASVSYAQLEAESHAFAVALQAMGVRRGDRVGTLLPNCPQFFVVELAVWKLGAILAPLNPIYTEHELDGPIREHGIETVVTLTRFYGRIKSVQRRVPALKRVVATNIKDYFPPLLKLLFTVVREKKDGDRIVLAGGDFRYVDLLAQYRGQAPPPITLAGRDRAVLLMSGGTTGTPKGVIGLHEAYIAAGLQIYAWVKSALTLGDSVILLPLPMFHVYAHVGVQALALITGNPIALVPNPRDLDDLVKTIRRVKPAFFPGVPTLYVALLNHRDVQRRKVDFKSIKLCFSGASALMADTKQRFEAMTGGRIVEGYSLTEGMMALCVNPVEGPNKLGSVGMPLPDVHVRIYDAEDGIRELPPGEVGEICFAGRQLMEGFWGQDEETAETLRTHTDPDGTRVWLHTGDLGYMDDDGYVFIIDRKKDLIKTSGFQVWPREVEEALACHPAVAEVGVAGVPDEAKGEVVRAWVVLRAGESVDEAALRAHCRERLAPYKVPKQIDFRTELPKTMVGKVLRRALRQGA